MNKSLKLKSYSFSLRQLAVIIVIQLTLRCFAADLVVGRISYDITSDSTCKVVASDAYWGSLHIPTEVCNDTKKYTVTEIDAKAFYNCQNLDAVSLPETIRTIGDEAFKNTSITEINIPDSIISIRPNAFTDSRLNEIYIGDAINRIGMTAFSFVSTVRLKPTIYKISNDAFEDADNMIKIYLPNSVKEIQTNTFAMCSQLQRVYINDVASWCNIKFENEYANPISKAGELYINEIYCTTLEIPSGVTTINDYAFYGCKNLTEVKLSETVERIGEYVFWKCENISIWHFGESLRYIGRGINSNNFRKIYTSDINSFCQIDSNESIFSMWYDTELIENGKVVTKINLQDNVTHIGSNILCNYRKLVSFSMTNSVKSLGSCAFWGCKSLFKVQMSDSIKIIPERCFESTNSLTKFNFPKELLEIGEYALEGISLAKIVLPPTTMKIGRGAFQFCKADTIILSDRITNLDTSTFWGCENLNYIYLGNSLETVQGNSFSRCPNLKSISLPSSMKTAYFSSYPDEYFPNYYVEKIYNYNPEPYYAYFKPVIYENVTLYVPYGCKQAYKENIYWSEFKNIIEMDELGGIEEPTTNSLINNFEIYDMNGRYISSSIENLRSGMYIMRTEFNVKKIFIR